MPSIDCPKVSEESFSIPHATIRNWARKDGEKPQTVKTVYTKPTAADQLNDAYTMMAAWSEEGQ